MVAATPAESALTPRSEGMEASAGYVPRSAGHEYLRVPVQEPDRPYVQIISQKGRPDRKLRLFKRLDSVLSPGRLAKSCKRHRMPLTYVCVGGFRVAISFNSSG